MYCPKCDSEKHPATFANIHGVCRYRNCRACRNKSNNPDNVKARNREAIAKYRSNPENREKQAVYNALPHVIAKREAYKKTGEAKLKASRRHNKLKAERAERDNQ